MLLLDTNVLSALISRYPLPNVLEWLAAQDPGRMFTSAICQAEILAGLAVLPRGRRRSELEAAALAMFERDFAGRVLPFDIEAAAAYAVLHANRRAIGRSVPIADLMIAATAVVTAATLVTRNVADFAGCGIAIVNPWEAA